MEHKEIILNNIPFGKAVQIMETQRYKTEDGKTFEVVNYKCESNNISSCTLYIELGKELTIDTEEKELENNVR